MKALAEGLGLETPGSSWSAIGASTSNLKPEDKVSLLAHIVPRVESGAFADFAEGLGPAADALEAKGMDREGAETVATELLAREILGASDLNKSAVARWLGEMPLDEANAINSARREMRDAAERELATYVRKREEVEERRKAEEARMQAEVEKAREERTTYFDEETGQFIFAGDDDED